MGFEARKTNRIRGEGFLRKYFAGNVLDIGCGADLVVPTARPFDVEHGDANRIGDYFPAESFDCVHSSHCLEHMRNVPAALAGWWTLVKPGGHLIIVVPHEDLYEQGYWPSVFNTDHKATFRLDAMRSWSPVSYDLRTLLGDLPHAEIIDIGVQDSGYDYTLLRGGLDQRWRRPVGRFLLWLARRRQSLFHHLGIAAPKADRLCDEIERRLGKPVAQTDGDAVAQIQAVVRKRQT
jgi:SAM-dependent methyltransferase